MLKGQTLRKRFEAKFVKGLNSDCWLWEGGTSGKGYGQVWNEQKQEKAHRAAWKLYRGEIPKGLCVCHSCDTPLCVNPNHLWLGSQAENIRDMHAKGRGKQQNGEAHHNAKLTEEDVRAIRASLQSSRKLALIFNISSSQVSRIKHREHWKYLVNVDFSFKNQNLQ